MRTKQYIVKVDRLYIAGATIPSGFTHEHSKAHRFDKYLQALSFAEKFEGDVQELIPEMEAYGFRAPQQNNDTAVQATV